ncbi:TetR/AcrR family transcriptional regulator [Variovorax sp. YR216]|uniref:TetR/AcrR family transcriptional regulator n=1 Tax=Variovorax sp. YR216 TaxID=1882828 RepID=UPI0008956C55|nr:TetR/AcrR family transcriptional regulator [Variovorax sp. YR216]SEB24538.1 transcriptional regulator, TetR family [Variovorax sp. YR216]
MEQARPYTMRARAASAEATRERILDFVVTSLKTRFRSEIRLDDVAAGADVSVQTVLNVYGSRAALLDQALARWLADLRAQRLRAEPGDTAGGLAALMVHYEQFGDLIIRNLAEQADPELIQTGRTGHRQWVQRQFGPHLAEMIPARRRSLVDALVCGCDVYTWKLLRRDMRRSRPDAEATMREIVEALLRAT